VRILTARRVITHGRSDATALAWRGEWVVAAGGPGELRARFPAARVFDLGDEVVVPGFNDAHQHPTICAEQLLQLDVSPQRVHTVDEVLAALAERASSTLAGQWIVASGFDSARTRGIELSREQLDQACPQHPVLVLHVTLHTGVINSQGLRLAGLRGPGDAAPGGALGHDAAGHLTGVLHDQALYDLAFPAFTRRRTLVEPPAMSDLEQAFQSFASTLHAAGITSVTDAMIGPASWDLLRGIDQRSALPVRVNALVAFEHFEHFRAMDQSVPSQQGRLRVGAVKAFADGAVNGGACWVDEPVIGATGTGMPRMPAEQLADIVREVHESGWRVAVHANGDRAIRVTLDAIAQAQRDCPRREPRHRVEHVSIINNSIVAAMRELGVVAVPFGQYPTAHGDKLRAYYEPARIERMFAHRELLEAGIAVAGSSDYPCGPFEPLYAMQSCVTRLDRNGEPFGASQRLTAQQALELYTTGSAYASAEEHTKGRLLPGYLADFVVLGGDPLRTPADQLSRLAVRQTWIGGQPVWSAPGEPLP
jgi:hypothetical protein